MQSERAGGHLARSSAFVLAISLHKQHDMSPGIVKYKRKDRDSDKLQQTHNELKLRAKNLVRLTNHACRSRHRQKVTLHRENL